MKFLLGLVTGVPLRLWLYGGAIAAAVGFIGWQVHAQRAIGRAEVRQEWDASVSQQHAAAVQELLTKAQESKRRLERQGENQRAQDSEIAVARADAAHDRAAADKLRQQNASSARDWAARLAHSPTVGDIAAAGDTIGVLADVLSRADARAGVLAPYADAARTAGLKCERDYDALTLPSTLKAPP